MPVPPLPAATDRTGRVDDLPEVQRLWAATFPHLPAPDLTAALAEGRVLVQVADEGAGSHRLVGAALVSPVADAAAERRLTVLADAPERWAAVEASVARSLREQRVLAWHVVLREDASPPAEVLETAGYQVTGRSWGASLEAADVDRARLARLVDRAAARGVHLRRLELRDAEAALRLLLDCRPDFPTTPATPAPEPTVDSVRQAVSGHGRAAFGAFTASGEGLVGFTALEFDESGEVADTDVTAVAADQRGRGVASALKAFAVLDLLDRGVRCFRTGGASVNEASLRANRRLGYAVEPVWTTWTRR